MKRTRLKSKPEHVKAWLRKSRLAGWLRSKKRKALAPRGRKYNERRAKNFGPKAVFVRQLPCLVCGRVPSDPHHEPPLSLGGDARGLCPLCRACHDYRHHLGSAWRFCAFTGVNLVTEAERIETEWRDAA